LNEQWEECDEIEKTTNWL